MRTLFESGAQLVAGGRITLEELLRVALPEERLVRRRPTPEHRVAAVE